MLRTTILAAFFCACGLVVFNALTHGMQVFTDEGARRLAVALDPVVPPDVEVDGPAIARARLGELLGGSGQVTIVDFIYTHCTSACLTMSRSLQLIQLRLDAETDATGGDRVRLLSISFDGARDTPDVLARHAASWSTNPLRWHFVRVIDPAEQELLLRRLGVVVIPDGNGEYEHNAALLVFDADGRLVRIFDVEERQLALDYARHLASERAREEGS